jgi:hypothetical protein
VDDSSHMNLQRLPVQPAARDRGRRARFRGAGGTAAVITGLPEPAEGQKGLAQTIRKDPAV